MLYFLFSFNMQSNIVGQILIYRPDALWRQTSFVPTLEEQ